MTIQGSKVRYSKFICPILQRCINTNNIATFVDVCVGGSNIIKNIKCAHKIGIDANQYLIALYHEMQQPNFVFPSFPLREDWDRCKDGDESRDWYVGLVSIFTSYLARGFGGGYNKQERQYTGRCNTMKKDLSLIQDIEYICADFSKMQEYENCVIYVDPPYIGTKKYDADKSFDYIRFWDCVRETSQKNYVFISEQQAPPDFTSIWSLETERQLQGNTTPCTENLFVFNNGLSSKFKV